MHRKRIQKQDVATPRLEIMVKGNASLVTALSHSQITCFEKCPNLKKRANL